MKSKRKIGLIIGIVLIFAITITLIAGLPFFKKSDTKIKDFFANRYKFEKEIVIDGKVQKFYQSGDEHFRYDHDIEGYVLLPNEDGTQLTYATKEGDKVVSSGVLLGENNTKVKKLTAGDLDRNDSLFKLEPLNLSAPNRLSSEPSNAPSSTLKVANLVVYVKFQGEATSPLFTNQNFSATFNPVSEYYSNLSQGSISLNSYLAKESSSEIYIYEAGNTRKHYDVKDSSSTERRQREYELVWGIFSSLGSKYDLQASDLDVLGPNAGPDGKIDSVSIIVQGTKDPVWGGLLWPHKWNIQEILSNPPQGKPYPALLGKSFGDYTFNFVENLDIGTVTHEMGHVFGAPDLYHYAQDYTPVGEWDLMSQNKLEPQYMLTHTRDKYIGGIRENQIVNISNGGTYTAYATTLSRGAGSGRENVPLAYKIPTSKPSEFIMLEMRSKNINEENYDEVLPGSGLIVYRVVRNIDGNQDALYQSVNKKDEIFVFRPSILMTPSTPARDRLNNSYYDVNNAFLSPNNKYFSSIGQAIGDETGKWDQSTIYYSDGSNTGIRITALSIDNNSVSFRVNLAHESTGDALEGKISIADAKLFSDGMGSGVEFKLNTQSGVNLDLLKDIQVELFKENGYEVFSEASVRKFYLKEQYSSGVRSFVGRFYLGDIEDNSNFFIHTRINTGYGKVESDFPTKLKLIIKDIDGINVETTEISIVKGQYQWEELVQLVPSISIYASLDMSLAVDKNGVVWGNTPEDYVPNLYNLLSRWDIVGKENIHSLAIGHTHVLALTNNFEVFSYGFDMGGELYAHTWSNIVSIAAGHASSYGVSTDGKVLYAGSGSDSTVSSWQDVVRIYAYDNYVVALKTNGRVLVGGEVAGGIKNAVQAESNVRQVGLGDGFVALLKNDGSIKCFGKINNSQSETDKANTWTNISKISASKNHLYALKNNNEVSVAGDLENENVIVDFKDIINLAAGDYHAVFFREDGVMEYVGAHPTYSIKIECENLIYGAAYKEAKDLEIEDIDKKINKTQYVIDIYDSLVKNQLVLNIASIYQDSVLATYKRIDWSLSEVTIEGKEYGNISVIEVSVPKAGNYEERLMSEFEIRGVRIGWVRLNLTARGTNITRTIDIEIRERLPLTGIQISGAKEGSSESPSIFLAENLSATNGAWFSLKVNKIPEESLDKLTNISYSCDNLNLIEIDGDKMRAKYGVKLEEEGRDCVVFATAWRGETKYESSVVVRVMSEIERVEVDYLNKTDSVNVLYGEDLNLERVQLKVFANIDKEDGGLELIESIVPISQDMLGSFNKKQVGEQNVTVTYSPSSGGVTTQMKIWISDYAISMSLLNAKQEYWIKEGFATSDIGNIELTFASGSKVTTDVHDMNHGKFSYLGGSPLLQSAGRKTFEVVYRKEIGVNLIQLRATYQVDVFDWASKVNLIDSNSVKRDFELGEKISDSPIFFELLMESGKKVEVDISQVQIEGFYENILGQHQVVFSYVSQINETKTKATDSSSNPSLFVNVSLQGSVEFLGSERIEDKDTFLYLAGKDLFFDAVYFHSSTSDKVFDVYAYNEEELPLLYYKYEVSEALEKTEDNVFYKNILGSVIDVSISIMALKKDEGTVAAKPILSSGIKTFGIYRWEILGIEEADGSFDKNKGTIDKPLEFYYNDEENYPHNIQIGLFCSVQSATYDRALTPSFVDFDDDLVDEKQEISIPFLGSKPKKSDGSEQKYYIKINDYVYDYIFKERVEINYGEENVIDKFEFKILKRKAGEVELSESDILELKDLNGSNFFNNLSGEWTDDGIDFAKNQDPKEIYIKYDLRGVLEEKKVYVTVRLIVESISVSVDELTIGYEDDIEVKLKEYNINFTFKYAHTGVSNENRNYADYADIFWLDDTHFNNTNTTSSTQYIFLEHVRSNERVGIRVQVKDYVKNITMIKEDEQNEYKYKYFSENNLQSYFKARLFYASEMEIAANITNRYEVWGYRSKNEDGEANTDSDKEESQLNSTKSDFLIPGVWVIWVRYKPAEVGEYVSGALPESDRVTITISNFTKELTVAKKEGFQTEYSFGESFDWDKIIVKYEKEYKADPKNSVHYWSGIDIINNCDTIYSAMQTGLVKVILKAKGRSDLDDAEGSFNITIKQDERRVAWIESNNYFKKTREILVEKPLFEKKQIIQVDKPIEKASFLNYLKHRPELHLFYNGVDLSLSSGVTGAVKSGDIIEIKNAIYGNYDFGFVVAKYEIYIVGDANKDGKVDTKDIKALAQEYVRKKRVYELFGVEKNDGNQLSSLVKVIRKIQGTEETEGTPAPSPINTMSQSFIAPAKRLRFIVDEIIITVV